MEGAQEVEAAKEFVGVAEGGAEKELHSLDCPQHCKYRLWVHIPTLGAEETGHVGDAIITRLGVNGGNGARDAFLVKDVSNEAAVNCYFDGFVVIPAAITLRWDSTPELCLFHHSVGKH